MPGHRWRSSQSPVERLRPGQPSIRGEDSLCLLAERDRAVEAAQSAFCDSTCRDSTRRDSTRLMRLRTVLSERSHRRACATGCCRPSRSTPDVSCEQVEVVAQCVLAAPRAPIALDGRDVFVGGRLGIAISTPGRHTVDDVLRRADLATYHTKNSGKGRFDVFSECLTS